MLIYLTDVMDTKRYVRIDVAFIFFPIKNQTPSVILESSTISFGKSVKHNFGLSNIHFFPHIMMTPSRLRTIH